MQNPPQKYQNLTINEKNFSPGQTAHISLIGSPSMRCKTQPSQPHMFQQFRPNLTSCSSVNTQ